MAELHHRTQLTGIRLTLSGAGTLNRSIRARLQHLLAHSRARIEDIMRKAGLLQRLVHTKSRVEAGLVEVIVGHPD